MAKTRKPTTELQVLRVRVDELEIALQKIAMLGHGIKEDVRDYGNMARSAIFLAREVLVGKCHECGKLRDFKGSAA